MVALEKSNVCRVYIDMIKDMYERVTITLRIVEG